MGKRIVLCFDGTWNTPAERFVGLKSLHRHFKRLHEEGEDAFRAALEEPNPGPGAVETNVCRFYRGILPRAADGTRQERWYDAGVGTEWFNRVGGGAFGLGLSRNIREGYHHLARIWQPDDEVYVLGFSRGAYTARSLVGMIRNCGLLPAAAVADGPHCAAMMAAYELYRTRDGGADSEHALAFRAANRVRDIRIHFLGVWDTVGALGIPVQSFEGFNRDLFKFHDTELSGIVGHAYHAIAVDEHRRPYDATLWTAKVKPHQEMEQRWFVGAHADVGGGYEDRQLSDLALAWMQGKAMARGLELHPESIPAVEPERNALGRLTDSFANFLGGLFRLFQERYYRQVRALRDGQERVDETVALRLRQDVGYRPRNPGLLDP